MTAQAVPPLPDWPATAPAFGGIALRRFRDDDTAMVRDLSSDPYVPLIGTLPAQCTDDDALAYVQRQRQRHAEGAGFSFAITDSTSDQAVGMIGLWLRDYGLGRAQAGYAVAPSARGRAAASDALCALTAFAWTLPGLQRIELHIEPWNTPSIAVAEKAGFGYEGLLRSYLEIGSSRRDLGAYSLLRTAPLTARPSTLPAPPKIHSPDHR